MPEPLLDERRCYIIGSVSQEPDGNREAFAAAAAQLKSEGLLPWNPTAEPDSMLVAAESAERIAQGLPYKDGPLYQSFMRRMFGYILCSRQVFVLAGFERSENALFECDLAFRTGTVVYDYATREVLHSRTLLVR